MSRRQPNTGHEELLSSTPMSMANATSQSTPQYESTWLQELSTWVLRRLTPEFASSLAISSMIDRLSFELSWWRSTNGWEREKSLLPADILELMTAPLSIWKPFDVSSQRFPAWDFLQAIINP